MTSSSAFRFDSRSADPQSTSHSISAMSIAKWIDTASVMDLGAVAERLNKVCVTARAESGGLYYVPFTPSCMSLPVVVLVYHKGMLVGWFFGSADRTRHHIKRGLKWLAVFKAGSVQHMSALAGAIFQLDPKPRPSAPWTDARFSPWYMHFTMPKPSWMLLLRYVRDNTPMLAYKAMGIFYSGVVMPPLFIILSEITRMRWVVCGDPLTEEGLPMSDDKEEWYKYDLGDRTPPDVFSRAIAMMMRKRSVFQRSTVFKKRDQHTQTGTCFYTCRSWLLSQDREFMAYGNVWSNEEALRPKPCTLLESLFYSYIEQKCMMFPDHLEDAENDPVVVMAKTHLAVPVSEEHKAKRARLDIEYAEYKDMPACIRNLIKNPMTDTKRFWLVSVLMGISSSKDIIEQVIRDPEFIQGQKTSRDNAHQRRSEKLRVKHDAKAKMRKPDTYKCCQRSGTSENSIRCPYRYPGDTGVMNVDDCWRTHLGDVPMPDMEDMTISKMWSSFTRHGTKPSQQPA